MSELEVRTINELKEILSLIYIFKTYVQYNFNIFVKNGPFHFNS